MKEQGKGLIALGLVAAVKAFFMGNTVDAPKTEFLASIGQSITTGHEQVFNLARAQLQMMILHVGCALFVAGVLLVGLGTVLERMAPEAMTVHSDEH